MFSFSNIQIMLLKLVGIENKIYLLVVTISQMSVGIKQRIFKRKKRKKKMNWPILMPLCHLKLTLLALIPKLRSAILSVLYPIMCDICSFLLRSFSSWLIASMIREWRLPLDFSGDIETESAEIAEDKSEQEIYT